MNLAERFDEMKKAVQDGAEHVKAELETHLQEIAADPVAQAVERLALLELPPVMRAAAASLINAIADSHIAATPAAGPGGEPDPTPVPDGSQDPSGELSEPVYSTAQ